MPLTVMSAGQAARLRAAPLTYAEVGGTAAARLPDSYHHLRRSAFLGSGHQAFAHAVGALMRWQVHVRAGPWRLAAPCRVVYVVDEPDRRGFAYGTLPGHPESGEEAFIISHDDGGAVTFTVTAFSRHSHGVLPACHLAGTRGRAARPRRPAPDHQPLPQGTSRLTARRRSCPVTRSSRSGATMAALQDDSLPPRTAVSALPGRRCRDRGASRS